MFCRTFMIAIAFALPEESRDFRERTSLVRERVGSLECWRGQLGQEKILVAHTGVGPAAASARANGLLEAYRPEMLIATGFAGGLDPALKLGSIVVATNFSAPRLLARARAIADDHCTFGAMVSEPTPAESVARKATLARATGAVAVDMETAAIADACTRARVPLLAVRAISDRAGDPLPVPFAHWFDLERQRPRVGALLLFLAQNPGRIAPFARFVRGLAPARRALADFLQRLIENESA